MLRSIHIENIAVIEKTDIEFSKGLNVLTGETGAGKSIIIDSIGAVTGSKIFRDIIRKGAEHAFVSAVFDVSDSISRWLEDNDFPLEEGELLLSRKITTDGKNTCRINGIPATLGQIRDLSSFLIDIHGQNDGRLLLDEKSHIRYLDLFGNYSAILNEYNAAYRQYLDTKDKIRALAMDDYEKERLSASLRATIDELGSAQVSPGEYDTITARRNLLRNSEKLTENIRQATIPLDGESEPNALSLIQDALYFISRASSISPELIPCEKKLQDVSFAVSDVSETLRDFLNSLDFSEEEYNELEDRISQLSRIFRKYNRDEEALCALLEDSKKKLESLETSDSLLVEYNRKLENQTKKCRSLAEKVSDERKKCALELQKKVEKELCDLSMPGVRFFVSFEKIETGDGFGREGMDVVHFLMSANAGENPGKISRIASGGELSRIMLALKNVFSEKDPVPTQIFDEIDAGVSGIAGQRVAEKLHDVSEKKQVMCVTHLPQIAAMADEQFLIEKKTFSDRTFTEIRRLDFEGRIYELARLYGGDHVTGTTKKSAEEQLLAAQDYKNR